MRIFEEIYQALMESVVEDKIRLTEEIYQKALSNPDLFECAGDASDIKPVVVPGRPEKPELVSPRDVKQRKLHHAEGRATLIHAIAHIEFNAINLALDACYRFRKMPQAYYVDWMKVASEEAYHFSLLQERLNGMGYCYGDFPAHNGLWEMAVKTQHDVLVRMALVPRVLEARGLDVTPGMIKRLQQAGDQRTVEILTIILRDEIGHVAIGSRWYQYCCEQRGIDPVTSFRELIQEYMGIALRGPFNREARMQAGFDQRELDGLMELE